MTIVPGLSVWQQLEQLAPADDTLIAKPAIELSGSRLLAGVDRFAKRHLLIRITGAEEGVTDRKTRGLWVETREYALRTEQPGRFIDMECRDPAGYQTFDLIAQDLARNPELTGNPAGAVRTVLERWRRFWRNMPQVLLGYEALLGLFGELWFLHVWLMAAVGPSRAVRAWRGPFGSRHDFEFPTLSVEVKTTSSASLFVHRINAIDQLSPPSGGPLYLFSVRVREEVSATNSIAALIHACRTRLADLDEEAGLLETALLQQGYSDLSEGEYANPTFRVVDERLYRVDGNFPRLTPGNLIGGVPSGVSTIAYDIDLTGSDAHLVAKNVNEAIGLIS